MTVCTSCGGFLTSMFPCNDCGRMICAKCMNKKEMLCSDCKTEYYNQKYKEKIDNYHDMGAFDEFSIGG